MSCGFLPVLHVRRHHTLVVATADAVQAVAELAGKQSVVVGLAEPIGKSDEPLEPVQVGLQILVDTQWKPNMKSSKRACSVFTLLIA